MSVFFLKFPGDNDMQFSVGTSDLEKPDQCSGSQLLRYIRITWGNFKKKKKAKQTNICFGGLRVVSRRQHFK